MLLFGLIFGGVGLFVGIMFVSISIALGELLFGLIGGGIGILFTIIGGGFIVSEIKAAGKRKEVLRNGFRATGVIQEVSGGSGVYVNGKAPLLVTVSCVYMGALRYFSIQTNSYNNSDYPVGACVDIAIDGVKAEIFENTTRFIEGVTADPNYIPQHKDDNSFRNIPQSSESGPYTVTVQSDGTYKYN